MLLCALLFIFQNGLHSTPFTTFHSHGSGYHKIDEDGMSPVGHGHSHSLLGNHGNASVRAAFIHVLGDLLQSFGVMVAAIVIYFRVNEHWHDELS